MAFAPPHAMVRRGGLGIVVAGFVASLCLARFVRAEPSPIRDHFRATMRTALEPVEPVPTANQVPDGARGRPPPAHYGAQILAADLVTMGWPWLIPRPPGEGEYLVLPALLSVAGYVTAGPTVHALHRQPRRALQSALLRVGAVAAGAGIGASAARYEDGRLPAAAIGATGGALTALVVDWSVLGRLPGPRRATGREGARRPDLPLLGGALLANAYVLAWFVGGAMDAPVAAIPFVGPLLAVGPQECHEGFHEGADEDDDYAYTLCHGPLPITNGLLVTTAVTQVVGAGMLTVGALRARPGRGSRGFGVSAALSPYFGDRSEVGVAIGGRF